MGVEIERKFLVKVSDLKNIKFTGVKMIKQGYLANSKEKSVRVRVDDNRAYITVKGGASGISKLEYEYDIPVSDATEMLERLTDGKLIEKKRHIVIIDNKVWEIDVFQGKNVGLIVAEVELKSENEKFTLPKWCGEEVSTNPKYINARLIENPYSEW